MCKPSTTSARHSRDDFAALAGHEASEFVGVALDELGEIVEKFGPADAALAPPTGIGGARGGDGLAHFLGGCSGETADDLVVVSRVEAVEGGSMVGTPFASDEIAASDDRGAHSAQAPCEINVGMTFAIVSLCSG